MGDRGLRGWDLFGCWLKGGSEPMVNQEHRMRLIVKRTCRTFHGTMMDIKHTSSNKAVNVQMLREFDKNYKRRIS